MPGVPTVFPKHSHKMETDPVLWEVVLAKALWVARSRNQPRMAQTSKVCFNKSETSDQGQSTPCSQSSMELELSPVMQLLEDQQKLCLSMAMCHSLMVSPLFYSLVWLPIQLHISNHQWPLGILTCLRERERKRWQGRGALSEIWFNSPVWVKYHRSSQVQLVIAQEWVPECLGCSFQGHDYVQNGWSMSTTEFRWGRFYSKGSRDKKQVLFDAK